MPTEVIGGPLASRFGRRARVAAISMLAIASLGLTACSGGGSGDASTDVNTLGADLTAQVDEIVTAAMQQSGSTAAIVGVWTGTAGDYVHAYGDGLAANATIRGAQATQPIMCALLLELVADGTVTLDRAVSEDVPRQVGIEDITYGQLCTAQSGLADFKGRIADIFANNPTRPWSERELLAHALAHSPLSWPGLDVHISDTDALVLARGLQQATGKPLSELLDTYVFEKVGMTSSSFPGDTLLATSLSGGMQGLTYPMAGGAPQCDVGVTEVAKVSPSMLGSAGAAITTARDLKTFYTAYLGGEFGGPEQAGLVTQVLPTTNPLRSETGEPIVEGEDAAARIAAADDPNGQKWGFGLEKVQAMYGQSGAITGTLTAAYHDPETGFTVVVALNNSSAGAGFVRNLAFELTAVATESGSGPAVTWASADFAAARAAAAICQPAAE